MTATAQQLEYLKNSIKSIQDYPKPGILFRDVTSLLEDPKAYALSIDLLVERYKNAGITKVVGTEARGFLFGAPVALGLGVGFVPVRKPGKLPRETISETYDLEYGTDQLEIHVDAIKPGDKVLVVDNGIYGKGFADFVSMYGGRPELYTRDYQNTLDVKELEAFLADNHDYKYATVVHGDTPSGMLNDVAAICPLLKKYGILTVVDSVSASFGEPLNIDACQIDIMCGGSQKVVSAPPGLTFVVVSDDAKKSMADRKTPIASFYANLTTFAHYYEEKWFPYTMPISDIYGLRAAIDNIAADPDILVRHEKIATASRKAITGAGLNLYLKSGFSNTVTVFEVPEETTAAAILDGVKKDYNIMLAGSFDVLAGKVIRIGHMGNNADFYNVREVFAALDGTLAKLGVPLKASMEKIFCDSMK